MYADGGNGNQMANQTKQTGVAKEPLSIFKPANLLLYVCFTSPIIIAIIIIITPLVVYQSPKGIVYGLFLALVAGARNYFFQGGGIYAPAKQNDGTVCTAFDFGVGTSTFSFFVSCFTLAYIGFPMIINQSMNWGVFSIFVFFIILDGSVKFSQGCIKKDTSMQVFFDIVIMGLGGGSLIAGILYIAGLSKFLFFNEMSSDKEVCTVPTKQTFKCSVYKNGELLGSMTP